MTTSCATGCTMLCFEANFDKRTCFTRVDFWFYTLRQTKPPLRQKYIILLLFVFVSFLLCFFWGGVWARNMQVLLCLCLCVCVCGGVGGWGVGERNVQLASPAWRPGFPFSRPCTKQGMSSGGSSSSCSSWLTTACHWKHIPWKK